MSFEAICTIQGVYYVITGVWPLVHMPSFLKVTGPKVDVWLVRMVGALALAIGIALLVATRETAHLSTVVLGVGSSLAFLGIDVVYVARKRIGKIYLLDAAAEVTLLLGWAIWGLSGRS